jgi:pyridoxine 5'-phosphate synthase PdxJ
MELGLSCEREQPGQVCINGEQNAKLITIDGWDFFSLRNNIAIILSLSYFQKLIHGNH